jgi:hypothetical protein
MSEQRYYVISGITGYGKVVKTGEEDKTIWQDWATESRSVAKLLNEETAPLLERIAELEAALEEIVGKIGEARRHNNYLSFKTIEEIAERALADKKADGNE